MKDTFEFCTKLEECEAEGNIEGTYMCSFDVTSLFTNIPRNSKDMHGHAVQR